MAVINLAIEKLNKNNVTRVNNPIKILKIL